MIMINGQWEFVRDFDEAIDIISENINPEFAKRCKELYLRSEEIEKLEDDISDLRDENDRLREEIGYLT